MMAVFLAIVGGVLAGTKTPFLSPILYLTRRKKDLFILAFLVYCLVLGYEVSENNIYEIDILKVFELLIPTVILLDLSLKNKKISRADYFFSFLALISYFSEIMFTIASFTLLAYNFLEDKPSKGVLIAGISVLALIFVFVVGKRVFDLPGSASTQAIVISALAITTSLVFWKKLERTEIFPSESNSKDFL